jgi:hypothetical protein
MRLPAQRAVLFAVCLLPSMLVAQQNDVEIGLDGGMTYSLDGELLTIAIPFQRVRAAFPMEHRLAIEPTFAFTRLSSNGVSLAALMMGAGLLYDLDNEPGAAYARPFFGLEYADPSFGESETVFDLGAGIGTRTRLVDRLALRFEGSITGRFGAEGGTDAVIGATVGLSFFTR